jgi:hypothetical protein
MTPPVALRYARIPLTHGSDAIPAVGFGTLIPDPLATTQATKAALEVGFRHSDCAERYRDEEAVGDAMQAAFKAGTTSSLRLSYGTPIIVLNGSNPPLTRVVGDCKSTMWIAISSIALLPFDPATSRTRGMRAVR